MKQLIAILLCASSFAGGQGASTRYIVAQRISGCDFFMVQSRSGYAILEWYGGHGPDKDDKLVGDLTGAGMKILREEATDSEVRVYIEDKGLSKSDAEGNLLRRCS